MVMLTAIIYYTSRTRDVAPTFQKFPLILPLLSFVLRAYFLTLWSSFSYPCNTWSDAKIHVSSSYFPWLDLWILHLYQAIPLSTSSWIRALSWSFSPLFSRLQNHWWQLFTPACLFLVIQCTFFGLLWLSSISKRRFAAMTTWACSPPRPATSAHHLLSLGSKRSVSSSLRVSWGCYLRPSRDFWLMNLSVRWFDW